MRSFPPIVKWQYYYDFRTGKKVFADDAKEYYIKKLAGLEADLQDAKGRGKAQWVINEIQGDMDRYKELLDEIEQQERSS